MDVENGWTKSLFPLKPGDLECVGSNWKKPADLAEIYVFYQDCFLCRAICAELSGVTVSLKDIEKARNKRRAEVRAGLSTRATVVEQFIAVHQVEATSSQVLEREQSTEPGRPRLKRYIHE